MLLSMVIVFCILHCQNSWSLHSIEPQKTDHYAECDWLVVGAGPAGIATLGVLIDIGIDPQRIIWLDPEFSVGRLSNYGSIPSNSKNKTLINFINACKVFQECTCPEIEAIKHLDPNQRDLLQVLIDGMHCLSKHVRTKVISVQDTMVSLHFNNAIWHIGTQQGGVITAHHVILATGSHPKTMTYATGHVIPFDVALNAQQLAQQVTADDVVGVVGGAHSAILILKFLSELTHPVKKIINFYKTPISYMVDMGTYVLNPNGIKGVAAEWAQNVLEKNPPAHLERIHVEDDTMAQQLSQCTKVIYAFGFERTSLPALNNTTPITTYNEKNGFIAPRLFGIGIAFPHETVTPVGEHYNCVSVDCFMTYAQTMIPHWMNDSEFKQATKQQLRAQLRALQEVASELFTIETL